MKRVSISERTARDLLGICCTTPGVVSVRARDELQRALSTKKSLPFPTRRQTKASKKQTKREETAAIREAVMDRAGDWCECGCGRVLGGSHFAYAAELDHFFPKSRTRQTVKTCWAITRMCHRDKTDNRPDRETWLRKFIAHANRHGFTRECAVASLQLEALELVDQAKAQLSEGVSHG